jgi:hypothetical protein
VRNSRTGSIKPATKPLGGKAGPARPAARRTLPSREFAAAARSLGAKISALEVADVAAAELAARWRLEIDAQQDKVIQWFAPAKQAAFRAHVAICRQENQALAPYREARRVINAKLAAWRAAQRHGEGPTERQPVAPPACVSEEAAASRSAGQIEGVRFREAWHAEVVDKIVFVKAIAERNDLVNLLEPNLTALGHLARAHKNALDIPGVRVWCDLSVATARRP